jgi:hypothetical protein
MSEIDSSETFKLKAENDKLKQIVKQMREDMEMLAMNDILPVKDVPMSSTLNKPSQVNVNENQGQNYGMFLGGKQ